MNAIRFETTVDEATARVIPALRPMLGKRVEVIALQSESETNKASFRRHTLEEVLDHRVDADPGAGPLSTEDIERAILEGALNGNS